jgi:hypothetical protein
MTTRQTRRATGDDALRLTCRAQPVVSIRVSLLNFNGRWAEWDSNPLLRLIRRYFSRVPTSQAPRKLGKKVVWTSPVSNQSILSRPL